MLLSGYTCDPAGGSEAANTWYTALELARAGAEVHLLTRESDAGPVRDAVASHSSLSQTLGVTFLPDHLPTGVPRRGQIGVYARYWLFQRRVARWVEDHRGGWDVAHHVSWGSINHPVGLAGMARPLVVGPVGGGQRLLPELKRWVDGRPPADHIRNLILGPGSLPNPWTRAIATHSDLILVASEETASLARRSGAVRVVHMPPDGITRRIDLTPRDSRSNVIVWVGRFLPIKAAGLAVQAFREVLMLTPDARMVMVGDGPTHSAVRSQASDLAPSGRLTFTGALPWDQAMDVMRSAGVHLFTSVRDSFGAQVIEAAALGVPTVGLDLAGLRSMRGSSAVQLVSPLPAASLPRRIGAALSLVLQENQGARESRSRESRELAEGLTYRNKAQQYLEFYRGIC